MKTQYNDNPFFSASTSPYETFNFPALKNAHFTEAIKVAVKEAKSNIKKIASNSEAPTFNNTLLALENATPLLDKVSTIYSALYSAHSDNNFKKLAAKIIPHSSKVADYIATNKKLFKRIEAIYHGSEALSDEQKRIVELEYKGYIRSGINLAKSKQKKLKKINFKKALLSPLFSKNVLNATNEFKLFVDESDFDKIKNIPKINLEAASREAKKENKNGYIFTLQSSSYIPFMSYCENRELRKKLYFANALKNCDGKFSNLKLIKKIIALREKKAVLLGYKNHAEFVLEMRMAKNPDAVFEFLQNLYDSYLPAAKLELAEIKKWAFEHDNISESDFSQWDYNYYFNKVRQEKFNFDIEEFRPYFESKKVIEGIFEVASRLYNLSFVKRNDIPLYCDDLLTYEVQEFDSITNEKKCVAILYIDLFPRETKQSGAWMNDLRVRYKKEGGDQVAHVMICANLTSQNEEGVSLLSYDEVNTIFHEFGHALHAILSQTNYQSNASPNVFWDFVELPSQIMENWLDEKECLELFATHYQSGEKISSDLIEKRLKSKKFGAGNFGLRQIMLGYLDMRWHTAIAARVNSPIEFEKTVTKDFILLPSAAGAAISPSFSHIFAGGYSAGYYSYKWAEVLDADAFEYFKEKGIFDYGVASRFRQLLSSGNKQDPMELYTAFRGKAPDPKALLRREGLE